MMSDNFGLVFEEAFLNHIPPSYHPENPDRLREIIKNLEDQGLKDKAIPIKARQVEIKELSLIHSQDHIERVRKACSQSAFLDPDTYTSSGSWRAALLAAGGLIEAVNAVVNNKVEVVASLIRPPGHHATRDRSMGFCLFNNAALAAAYATEIGLSKVVIIDWDAHHGNGTQQIFYQTEKILYISLHQFPHYPGSGQVEEVGNGKGEGFNINFPFPPFTGGQVYRMAFEDVIKPIIVKFNPKLFIVSAGYDGHNLDPLSSLRLSNDDFAWFACWLRSLQRSISSLGIIISLEGGYNLQALATSVANTISSLIDNEEVEEINEVEPAEAGTDIPTKVFNQFCRYWNL